MAHGLFRHIDSNDRDIVRFMFDDVPINGFVDDTILAALLRHRTFIGHSEFDGAPRAGFCLMGSCQECTLWDEDGRRLRACMIEIQSGMVLRSAPYADGADGE